MSIESNTAVQLELFSFNEMNGIVDGRDLYVQAIKSLYKFSKYPFHVMFSIDWPHDIEYKGKVYTIDLGNVLMSEAIKIPAALYHNYNEGWVVLFHHGKIENINYIKKEIMLSRYLRFMKEKSCGR